MKIMAFAALAVGLTSVRVASARTLSRGDIQRGIQPVRPAVEACLRAARVSSMVKVRLEIMDGRVVAAQARAAAASGPCVERAVRKARFRRTAERITMLYPFVSPVAPSPSIRRSGTSRLSREKVVRGISAIHSAVNRCRPPSAGRVLVIVRIDIADGRVVNAHGRSSNTDARTLACVERAVSRASFPPAEAMSVQYPFVLH